MQRNKPPNMKNTTNKQPCPNCGQYHSHTSDVIAKLKNTPFYRFKDVYLQEFDKFRGHKEGKRLKTNLPSWFHEDDEIDSKKDDCQKLLLEQRLNESSILNRDIEASIETRSHDSQNSKTVKKVAQNKRHFISSMDLIKSRSKTLSDISKVAQNQESEKSLQDKQSQSRASDNAKHQSYSIANKSKSSSNTTTIHRKSEVWHNFVEKRSMRQNRDEGLVNEVNCFEYNCGEESTSRLMNYSEFKPQQIIRLEQKKFQPASTQRNPSIAQIHLPVIDSLNSNPCFQSHYKINIYLDKWK